jgi:hypothetical protein
LIIEVELEIMEIDGCLLDFGFDLMAELELMLETK